VTLRKDCKCACHAAPHAVVHVHPCCGPGSEGWPPEVTESDPYEALTLFRNDKRNKKPATVAPADKSGDEKS
jgi:hypothetical protein